MQTLNTILEKRISSLNIIQSAARGYFDIIQKFVLGDDPGRHAAFLHAVADIAGVTGELEARVGKVPKFDSIRKMLGFITELYDIMQRAESHLDVIIGVTENSLYLRQSLYNMSQTYSEEIQRNRSIVESTYMNMQQDMIEDDDKLFHFAEREIGVGKNAKDVADYIIENISTLNKFHIHLIKSITGKLDEGRNIKLRRIMEHAKDEMLGSGRADLGRYDTVQMMTGKYSLCPVSACKPLAKLYGDLGLEYNMNIHPEDNIKLIPETGCGVVVLKKLSGSPVGFDIRPLISDDYVIERDLLSPPGNGLNKKIIERFQTATTWARKPGLVTQYHHKHIIPETASRVYVFDTLDNYNYRVLSDSREYTVAAEKIRGIVKGLSTRPIMYSKLQIGGVEFRDPKSQTLLQDYEDAKMDVIPSESVIRPLREKLLDMYNGVVDEYGDLPTEPAEIRDMITGDANAAGKIISRELRVHQDPSTEYTLSYIVRLDKILSTYNRDLYKQLSMRISPAVIALQSDMGKYIKGVVRDSVDKVIGDMDANSMWTDVELSLKEFFISRKYIND